MRDGSGGTAPAAQGGAARRDRAGGVRGIRPQRLRGDQARRCGGPRRHHQGHDLPVLPEQGGPVPRHHARDEPPVAGASGGAHRGAGGLRHGDPAHPFRLRIRPDGRGPAHPRDHPDAARRGQPLPRPRRALARRGDRPGGGGPAPGRPLRDRAGRVPRLRRRGIPPPALRPGHHGLHLAADVRRRSCPGRCGVPGGHLDLLERGLVRGEGDLAPNPPPSAGEGGERSEPGEGTTLPEKSRPI